MTGRQIRNPRIEALAFRIWAYAQEREWNCGIAEIADALRESDRRIGAICAHRGWSERLNKVFRGRNSERFLMGDSNLEGTPAAIIAEYYTRIAAQSGDDE